MKTILLLLAFIGGFVSSLNAQSRYYDEIFSTVNVTPDITYGTNITVITGSPTSEDLKMDIYQPAGDVETSRPVVILVHGGSFLPEPYNGQPFGSKNDSSIVEMSMRLAKRGYVVAAIDFRYGWNPLGTQEERTGTYINALYRTIQDIRNAVRFFKWSVDNGNPYGVANDKFSVIGEGTGAMSALGVGSLTDPSELTLPKFIHPSTTDPYVDISLSGNVDGTNSAPLNLPNYPSYSSTVNFIGNLGGAVGDSTWIEAGEPPIVSFHCPNDPYAPYGYGALIVNTTGSFVVDMSGSYDINRTANSLGNNDVYINAGFNDAITVIADSRNNGRNGLYPFPTASVETAPWHWWDTSNQNSSNGMQTNPNMSETKAQHYIDTVIWYMTPRMAISNGYISSSGVDEFSMDDLFSVFPNPTNDFINLEIAETEYEIEVVNMRGQVLFHDTNIQTIDVKKFEAGTYIIHVQGMNFSGQQLFVVE